MGVAIRYVNQRHEAQEIVNDAFLKAFKNISKYFFIGESENDDYYAFRGWLTRIAVTTALDHIRAKKQRLYIEDMAETLEETLVEVSTNLDVQDRVNNQDRKVEEDSRPGIVVRSSIEIFLHFLLSLIR